MIPKSGHRLSDQIMRQGTMVTFAPSVRAIARAMVAVKDPMLRWLVAGVVASTMSVFALAQDRTEGGRYQLEKSGDAWLRLDRETGDVSTCTETSAGWACRAAADDRAALEAEIARLSDEIAALRKRLDAPKTSEKRSLDLPSRKEVDEMMTFMEDVMTRFKDMADRLNEEFNKPKPKQPPEKIPDKT